MDYGDLALRPRSDRTRSLRGILAALVAAIALALSPGMVAQQTEFRGAVQTVPLYATVLDKSGRLVSDLQEKDFEIYDNGQRQSIAVFKSDVQPVTVMLSLDTSGSMTFNLELLKDAAEAFVIRLLPDDKARVMNFDDKITISPSFTRNRDDLVEYIHHDIDYGNGTRLWDAVSQSLTALSVIDGRRVVLLFTDGKDEGSRNASLSDVLVRARASDVMVYGVGFHSVIPAIHLSTSPDKGLKTLADETGGGYFELSKAADLNATFTRVADELHRQYVLGFSPVILDGKVHTLDLRVTRPGMVARARTSYVAAPSQ